MQALLKVYPGQKLLNRFLYIRSTCSISFTSVLDAQNIKSQKLEECLNPTKFCGTLRKFRDTALYRPQRFLTNSSTKNEKPSDKISNDKDKLEFKPFYRLPSIVGLRILSRIKIAQTCLTLAILPPLSYYHDAGMVTTWQLQFSMGAATFALFMLYTMSFYLRRVVGAMYLHQDGNIVKVSHLTFWGSRRDTVLPVMDVVPLSEGTNKADEVLKKLERYSTKDILYFTLRFGRVIDVEAFENVFGRP